MSSFSPSLLPLVSVALALPACSVSSVRVNEDHCTNQDGDAYCGRLFPDKPFCTKGVDECALGDRYGCVADVAAECREPCGELGGDGCEGMSDSSSGTTTGSSSDTDMEGSTGTTGSTTGPECMGDEDCMDPVAPFCGAMGECVSCDGADDPDGACAELDPTTPICDAGACISCTAEQVGACEGMTPVCGEDNECVACTEHDQCPDSACHLDGELQGACFDAAEVVQIQSVGDLVAEISALSDGDNRVLVLATADYNQTANIAVDAEVALLGPASAELTGSPGLPSLNVAGPAIVYLAGPSIASGETGVSCSGASVWLDDSEVRNNAQAGLEVSGGCAAHLRRSVVRANGSGGIVALDSPVYLVNSAVGENLDAGSLPGIQLTNGELWMTYSSVVANLAVGGAVDSVQCFGVPSGDVRNSVVLAASGSSIAADCDGIGWSNNALDTADLDTVNGMAMNYDAGWFDPVEGDYHLTTAGETALMDIAVWQDGDPMTDVDGDPIPTDVASFPGYDQP